MNKNLQNHNSGYKELKERYLGSAMKTNMHEVKGDVLKKAREAQGFSLESVHEATKVPLDVLKGIEEGYRIGNVSAYYIKGFVKIYAKYLGVDIHQIIENFSSTQLPKKEERDVEDFDWAQYLQGIFTKRNKKKIVFFLLIVVGILLLGKVFAFILRPKALPGVSKKQESAVIKPVIKKEDKDQKKIDSKKKTEKAPSVKAVQNMAVTAHPAEPSISSASLKDMVVVVVRAKATSWLIVKSDGETVFQGELKLGEVETWTAKEKIELSGRRISQLEFEINGKLIGSLGREDRQAKTVIINKSGLSVTK